MATVQGIVNYVVAGKLRYREASAKLRNYNYTRSFITAGSGEKIPDCGLNSAMLLS